MLLLLYAFHFWPQACGILALQPRIKPAPPALEGKVLASGPSEKSPDHRFDDSFFSPQAETLELLSQKRRYSGVKKLKKTF